MCAWRRYAALSLVPLFGLLVAQVGSGYQTGDLKPVPIPTRCTLKGTVTFDGPMPDLAALSKAKLNQINGHQDKATCLKAPQDQIDQRVWMIGPKGGVANVAVYVRPELYPNQYFALAPADLKPYQAGGAKHEVAMDQPFCAFLPPVLLTFPEYYNNNGQLVPTGQVVEIKNSAAISHNSKWGGTLKNAGANPIIPPGGKVALNLAPDRFAIPVNCSIHPWMEAKILALDHPFGAVTDQNGNYEIKDVPAGVKLRLFAWHETGFVSEGGFKGEPLELKAGETAERSFKAHAAK